MVECGGLENRYGRFLVHRGFESLPLRFVSRNPSRGGRDIGAILGREDNSQGGRHVNAIRNGRLVRCSCRKLRFAWKAIQLAERTKRCATQPPPMLDDALLGAAIALILAAVSTPVGVSGAVFLVPAAAPRSV